MNTLIDLIRANFTNEVALLLISMLPLIEVKGAIPVGLAMGLDPLRVYGISFIGSTIPAIFILMWIMPIFSLMKKNEKLGKLALWAESKAFKRDERIRKYQYWGLFLFTAIPLPGTGVWMGSLIASILTLRKRKSFLTIAIGNLVAASLIFTFSSFFF
ncbi:MAG: small multi-drug export protein [Anaerococcus sp.]|nr:small multi-drug export protein [Anaerococcus sp.]